MRRFPFYDYPYLQGHRELRRINSNGGRATFRTLPGHRVRITVERPARVAPVVTAPVTHATCTDLDAVDAYLIPVLCSAGVMDRGAVADVGAGGLPEVDCPECVTILKDEGYYR